MSQDKKVYVIDDDPAMRDSLDFLLGSAGFNVRVFDSAQVFLDELAKLEPGCVVTDVRMPGIDGMELLRRVNSGARKLPVIVMTGHGDVPLAVEAMKLGALDFLEKPFEDDRLIGMIETALSEQQNGSKSEAAVGRHGCAGGQPHPARAPGDAGAGDRAIEQDDRQGIRYQPPHGGGLSGERHDQDAGR